MPSPSLGELVIESTQLMAELFRELRLVDSEQNMAVFMQLAVTNDLMQRAALKRVDHSVAERMRRAGALRAVHLKSEIPAQRG